MAKGKPSFYSYLSQYLGLVIHFSTCVPLKHWMKFIKYLANIISQTVAMETLQIVTAKAQVEFG